MSQRRFLWVSLLVVACGAGSKPGSQATRGGGSGNSSTGGGADINPDPGGSGSSGINVCDPSVDPTCGMAAPPGCGDGKLTSDEACDDGNTVGGDGCSANCLVVEPGYSCIPAGVACHKIARCGDGLVADSEACDDGNTTNGDGCSSTCKLELGY
ncbi:MAG TPA: DUF4215 domain-containing protein, partial [Polyangiaceae bacterium]|nr:DUF4215 domain-containing protein [Polyangiaceae bacterium]